MSLESTIVASILESRPRGFRPSPAASSRLSAAITHGDVPAAIRAMREGGHVDPSEPSRVSSCISDGRISSLSFLLSCGADLSSLPAGMLSDSVAACARSGYGCAGEMACLVVSRSGIPPADVSRSILSGLSPDDHVSGIFSVAAALACLELSPGWFFSIPDWSPLLQAHVDDWGGGSVCHDAASILVSNHPLPDAVSLELSSIILRHAIHDGPRLLAKILHRHPSLSTRLFSPSPHLALIPGDDPAPVIPLLLLSALCEGGDSWDILSGIVGHATISDILSPIPPRAAAAVLVSPSDISAAAAVGIDVLSHDGDGRNVMWWLASESRRSFTVRVLRDLERLHPGCVTLPDAHGVSPLDILAGSSPPSSPIRRWRASVEALEVSSRMAIPTRRVPPARV